MTKNKINYIPIVLFAIVFVYVIGGFIYNQFLYDPSMDTSEFKAEIIGIQKKRYTEYIFKQNDAVFFLVAGELDDEFIKTIEVGDSVFKVKYTNYCIIKKKDGSRKKTKYRHDPSP